MNHLIEFENVVQRFRIIRERPDTLREAFSKLFRHREPGFYDFQALKGVSFSIGAGESVGIIGRNGSGKSTLLKIIAGVYQPSSGKVTVRGKVAALIELAAGFHPELTGRENIVLNGLLLGLTRREIREKEDAILEFAGVGDFIDSPVKQYSSGMFMRLGFAVAVQVEPEILLMDEIFSVGDAAFQMKCLQRIDEFRDQGRTTVLVSHSMAAVRLHCRRVLLIDRGKLVADGTPDEVIPQYYQLQGELEGALTGSAQILEES